MWIYKIIGLSMSTNRQAYIKASSQEAAIKKFIDEFPLFTDELQTECLFCLDDVIETE